MKKEKILDYPFTIRHLSKEDGVSISLNSQICLAVSDGETIEEAITNGHDAVNMECSSMTHWRKRIDDQN